MGAAIAVPEAIRRLGLDVTLLTDDDLASDDLARYGTIVVGVRAAEPAGVRRRQRAAAAVRPRRRHADRAVPGRPVAGRSLSRLPADGNARVSDERAPVTLLEPQHPAFDAEPHHRRRLGRLGAGAQRPLRLGDLRSAARIKPAIRAGRAGSAAASSTPGSARATTSTSCVVPSAPPDVPGAYRLFANLLSLGRTSRRRARAARARIACRRRRRCRQAKRGSTPTASSQPSAAAQARSSWANAASWSPRRCAVRRGDAATPARSDRAFEQAKAHGLVDVAGRDQGAGLIASDVKDADRSGTASKIATASAPRPSWTRASETPSGAPARTPAPFRARAGCATARPRSRGTDSGRRRRRSASRCRAGRG